jgi:hypothetical protein
MAIIYSYPLAEEVTNESWVLGSEMDNGSRVVKNYSVGDLVSFTRGFVTLNDVLGNNNESLLNAKVGSMYLYDATELDYGYISLDDSSYNFYNISGNMVARLNSTGILLSGNLGPGSTYTSRILVGNISAHRTYGLPNASGTIALTSNLLDYVPYTGATQSIDLGNYDIFTAGNARLGDDGTVWGSSFQFGNNGSLQSAAQSSMSWTLPDEGGVIALTKYKVYVAIVTQSGSTNPVATVLENTIGAITITRGGTGQYTINSSGLFEIGKTTFDLTPIQGFIKQGPISNPSGIFFETRDDSNASADGLLTAKKLEIRVYN